MTSLKLRRYLFIYLAVTLLILSTLLLASTIPPFYNRLKKAENQNLAHSAEMKAIAINEWGRKAQDIALQITSRTSIRQELERYNHGEISLTQIRSFTTPKLVDAMNQSDEIIGIVRLDALNHVIAQCGLKIDPANWPVLNVARDVIKTSIPIHSGDTTAIVVGAWIKNHRGERVGIDLVLIDLSHLKSFISNTTTFNKDIETVLAYLQNGKMQSVIPCLYEEDGISQRQQFNEFENRIMKTVLQGNSGIVQSGDTVIAYHPIDNLDWGLLIRQDKKQLYSSLNTILGTVILISVTIYLVCLLGLNLMIKPLSDRILLNAEELEGIIQEKTEQIKLSLEEKEILLKEIHHRVKNNLSVVSSLLGIQAERTVDNHLKSVLNDSQNRIHTMAAIHESLCRSDNLAAVDLSVYLHDLGNQILGSYRLGSRVTLNINMDPIFISVAQASPVGLIINELITNSLKHAFSDDRAGEISILLKNPGEEIELVYTDNGIGFPPDLDLESTNGLGLKLITMLCENQLKGTLALEQQSGTRFIIRFLKHDPS